MNYQFFRTIEGKPSALFEMGNEVFSQWFTEELGQNSVLLENLIGVINQLEKKQIHDFVFDGKDSRLILNQYEVEAKSKRLDIEAPDELPEGTELYDIESIAGSGLEDFKLVVNSWKAFIEN
jgi:uncharacterized protein YacL (UPF0231 family)